MNGISSRLSGEFNDLPLAIIKAFNHWPGISNKLNDLFKRAPKEVVADDMAVLARVALQTVEGSNYPADLVQEIRYAAHINLVRSAETNRDLIAEVIAESVHLLKAIDGFIMCVQHPENALPRAEAEAQVRKFLDWCGQLDRELSGIPVRLREGITNDR